MYKTILQISLFVFVLFQTSIKAQESNNENKKMRFFGIEACTGMLFPNSPEFEFIRGDVLPYSSGGVSGTLKAFLFKNQLGLKTEFRNKTNRWGLLLGLDYSRINTILGKQNLYNSSTKYFYLLDNQTGTTTEYFRIREINRTIDFIGVPLELRWLSNSPKSLKLYLKLGLELDFKINSTSSVVFHDQDMSEYQDIVLNKFEKAGSFFSAAYFATGINLNKKPNIDLEFIFPYIVLTPKTTGILESHSGIGAKLEIRLPY
jgi:hypothetical protein